MNGDPLSAMKVFYVSLWRAAWLIAGLALLLVAQGAQARCVINEKLVNGQKYIPKDINMIMGQVVVPPDLPVGSLITTPRTFPIFQKDVNNVPFDCSSGEGTLHGAINSAAVFAEWSGKEKVFATSVQGIGIRLLRRAINGNIETFYPHTLKGSFGAFSENADFVVELYKIAEVTGSGPLVSGIYTTYSGDDGISAVTTRVIGDAITIITPTCKVGGRDIQVPLGKVALSAFKGRGTTVAEKNFTVVLQCSAGVGVQKIVWLRLDANADPAGDAGVLRLTQEGQKTATGVGIQVLDEQRVPVKYAEATKVGESKTIDYPVRFSARYFQTGDKVTPGSANGTATITIEYR